MTNDEIIFADSTGSPVEVWARSHEQTGRVHTIINEGFFIYVVRSPQVACRFRKIGVGEAYRLRQWEERSWQVEQYARFLRKSDDVLKLEQRVKFAICKLRKHDWPFPYSGWQEAWLREWGTISLQLLIASDDLRAIPMDLMHAALRHGEAQQSP